MTAAPARAPSVAIAARLLVELPAFASMHRVMTLQKYTLSALAQVRLRDDGTVHARLVWRRGEHGCAALRQPITGELTDRVLVALGDALL